MLDHVQPLLCASPSVRLRVSAWAEHARAGGGRRGEGNSWQYKLAAVWQIQQTTAELFVCIYSDLEKSGN